MRKTSFHFRLVWQACSSKICLSAVSFDIARLKHLWSSSTSLMNSWSWVTRSLLRWNLKMATKSLIPNLIHWCGNTVGNLDYVARFCWSLSQHIFWISSIMFSTNWATLCATSFWVSWSKASNLSFVNDPWSLINRMALEIENWVFSNNYFVFIFIFTIIWFYQNRTVSITQAT